jgi:hypothetical protein
MNYLDIFLYMLPIVYPATLYILPVKHANKLSVGIDVLKAISNGLDNAKNTKGGFTSKSDKAL